MFECVHAAVKRDKDRGKVETWSARAHGLVHRALPVPACASRKSLRVVYNDGGKNERMSRLYARRMGVLVEKGVGNSVCRKITKRRRKKKTKTEQVNENTVHTYYIIYELTKTGERSRAKIVSEMNTSGSLTRVPYTKCDHMLR